MLLPPDDIQKSIATYNWEYVDKQISKTYSFDTYMQGIDFIQKIAELSERSNHHPDIYIGWCKVEISIFCSRCLKMIVSRWTFKV